MALAEAVALAEQLAAFPKRASGGWLSVYEQDGLSQTTAFDKGWRPRS